MTAFSDLKLYFLNVITLAFNFTKIELTLKILLTAVVMGYTIHKWVIMNEERKLQKKMDKLQNAAENKAKDRVKASEGIIKNGIVRRTKFEK
tara:strand:+ start:3514 stop:3789 length:276 start_codon:yes stop_codon:yes gene_type:complete